ncbi:hypothetical protein [Halosegnis longus]|uniref:hypothetical protein n=1 Tax=Halosegnis longus TaxID=2216012 RepID=UPI0013563026|nr:hypothetical protein [Salella cibi]
MSTDTDPAVRRVEQSAEPTDMMEPVAFEHGFARINQLKRRFGRWLRTHGF